MMQAIRGRAGSIMIKILFGLLIISFGYWGIYVRSPFSQSGSQASVVATVGSQDITADQVQQVLRPTVERLQAQFGGALQPEQLKQLGVLDSVVAQLVDRSLLDQQGARLGLDVSDEVVKSTIYDNPAFRGQDGRFDRQLFDQTLAMNHLTEDQLVARLRHDIPRADLLQAITAGAGVPQPVAEALYRYRNETRVADIVSFPAASVANIGQPSDADLQKFYNAHKDGFRAPEFRGLTIASLAPADLKPGPIPDAKLRQEYQQRQDQFATPEQREIQQILAPSEAKAKQAEAELAAGKDWKAVATGLGQASDTVDLGLLSPKEIPHELGDVAFKLPLNQMSGPVKSPIGWHILRVVKIVPGSTQTFDQAKPKLEKQLQLEEAVDRLDKIGNEADDALAGGAALADVAKKYGLRTTSVAAIDEQGQDPAGKAVKLPVSSADILKTGFATDRGQTSRVTDTPDGAIFAVKVDKVAPPEVRPLAAVKDKATALWQAEQKRAAANKQAQTLAAAVKPDAPLSKAAAASGATVMPAVSLSRTPQPNQKTPAELVAKLFAAKPGAVVIASDDAGSYVAQLKEVQSPKSVPPAAAQGLSDQLANEAKLDLAQQYTDALRRRFPVDIKRDALDRMF